MDIDRLFEEKQPPAGGLFRLRKRLRKEGGKRFVRGRVLAWSACVLVLLTIGFNQPEKPKPAVINLMPLFLAHDLPTEQVQVKNGAAIKLFESDTVVYFQLIQPRNTKKR